MFEIASQMILCLLLAALLGFIIGYLFGKMTCASDDCGHTEESDVDSHETDTITSHSKTPVSLTRHTSTDTKEALTSTTQDTVTSLHDTTVDIHSKSNEDTTIATNTSSLNDTDTKKSIDTNTRILTSPRSEGKNNLSRIKGIGTKIEESLNDIGVYHFDQIAAWGAEDITWADETLGFPGRVDREKWVEQAKILATGGDTEFSKRVAEGKVESSK
ncbi:MAG: hypothetical protein L3J43_08580 [Sulfurovum sp.]|nr:hypothetical protein [Sulfurovum sp.]